MTDDLKRLTILAPIVLEEPLVDALLNLRPALPGFTTMNASGHGARFDDASIRERVRGRIERSLLWLVLPADDVSRVLQHLRSSMPHPEIVWWVEPVESMGRLV